MINIGFEIDFCYEAVEIKFVEVGAKGFGMNGDVMLVMRCGCCCSGTLQGCRS